MAAFGTKEVRSMQVVDFTADHIEAAARLVRLVLMQYAEWMRLLCRLVKGIHFPNLLQRLF